MSNDIFEMACDLVNPDGGELNEHQENEVQALVNFAKSCNADMQARIEKLETENSVMYAALLEASELGNSAAMRCKVELQRIARNEAK